MTTLSIDGQYMLQCAVLGFLFSYPVLYGVYITDAASFFYANVSGQRFHIISGWHCVMMDSRVFSFS